MKKNLLPLIIAISSVLFVVNSCSKTDTPAIPGIANSDNSDLTTKVSTSVSGFVTDESNVAVASAAVTAGTKTTTTDANGYFEIKDVSLVANAAVVTVSKTGYFNGIKTWIAANGKSGFFRMKLLAKTSTGTVSGTAGGTVTLANGLKIGFPAAAFVNASTNAAYTGTVTVNAKWIDPTSAELNNIMPGDLRGKDASGALKALTTYGMSATELSGTAGELLQIATGKKATITFPIPASILSSAPATIPLWTFNETNGLWKEEGSATKTGSTYVGDVSHFSFWNCDVPANYVVFDATINDAGGNAVQNAYLKITNLSNGDTRFGYTNNQGYVSGAVPANASLLIQVISSPNCSFILHTQNFSTAATNISLGIISLLSNRTATVTGTLTNCTGNAVANGSILIYHDNIYTAVNTNASGIYSASLTVCSGTTVNVTLVGIDPVNAVQGSPVSAILQAGSSNPFSLQACGTSSSEYFNYSFSNNTSQSYNVSINDSVYLPQFSTTSYYLKGKHNPNGTSSLIEFSSAIALNQSYSILTLNDSQFGVSSGNATNNITATTTITELGAIGTGFIKGNISGTVTTPALGTLTITGNFRVRRVF